MPYGRGRRPRRPGWKCGTINFRLYAGNHPSPAFAGAPLKGEPISYFRFAMDAKRPEGWFLAANLKQSNPTPWNSHCARRHLALPQIPSRPIGQGLGTVKTVPYRTNYNGQHTLKQSVGRGTPPNSTLLKNRNLPYPHNKGNTQKHGEHIRPVQGQNLLKSCG